MIAGSVKAFQSHASHRGIPIASDANTPATPNSERKVAPGGTVQFSASTVPFITYYDGVSTTIKLPPRNTLSIGASFTICNLSNTVFTLTVNGADGSNIYDLANMACATYTVVDTVSGTDSNYWYVVNLSV